MLVLRAGRCDSETDTVGIVVMVAEACARSTRHGPPPSSRSFCRSHRNAARHCLCALSRTSHAHPRPSTDPRHVQSFSRIRSVRSRPSFRSSSMPHLATPPTVTDTSFPETPLVYRNHEPRRRRVFSSPTRTLFPCAKPCCSSASVTPCTRTANVLCSHVPSPAAQRVCAASPCRLPLPCALRGRYQDVKPTRTALTRHSWPPTIPPHSLDLGLRSKP